jgi:hypothetical protein
MFFVQLFQNIKLLHIFIQPLGAAFITAVRLERAGVDLELPVWSTQSLFSSYR